MFAVLGILPGYLHDWRSRHFATLLEWKNPDYVERSSTCSADRSIQAGLRAKRVSEFDREQ